MKKIFKSVLILCVAAFFVIYFGYKIYQSVYPNYSYESAIEYTYSDRVYKDCYIIRDEEIIYGDTEGIRSYTVSNGTRVSKGSPILNVYENEAEASYAAQIQDLDSEIEMLESIETSSASTGELESTKNMLKEELKQLSENIEQKNLTELQTSKNDILYCLNKKQVIVGDEYDFSERINSLKDQKAEIQSRQSDSPVAVKSPGTGYFIADIDGKEAFINIDDAEKLTPSDYDRLISQKAEEVKSDAIGKLVKKYHWYITLEVTAEEAEKIKNKSTVKINIPSASLENIDVSVEALNYNSKKTKAVAVFKCGYMSTALSTLRNAEIEINLASYNGIRINSKAIHFQDGEKGVYVLVGSQIKFRKVDIIYSGNGYVISSMKNTDSSYVKRYDSVVVSGKDLYDGKLVG